MPGEFDFAKSSDGSTSDEIQAFLEESVKDGCEGLMVKMLESDASYYEPSRRSVNWLKVLSTFCSIKFRLISINSSRKIISLVLVILWTSLSLADTTAKANVQTFMELFS